MKFLKTQILLLLTTVLLTGCSKDLDTEPGYVSPKNVKDFIWRAMNSFYLYQSDITDLADNRFATESERLAFLSNFRSPEAFYDHILSSQDRFSYITEDYVVLEQLLSGTATSNGMEFGLHRFSEQSNDLYGAIRLVLPNTDAAIKGITRGMIFNTINGQQLNISNYRTLIGLTSYTLGLATKDGSDLIPTGESIELTKRAYTENPIFIEKVIPTADKKIGYLMYNGFIADFDHELNAVFGRFKNQAIDELVLDLRYNSGGSVRTAIDLSAMITGQFTGEIFTTENWNSKIQDLIASNDPDRLINRFTDQLRDNQTTIQNLGLTRLYVLTTKSSASASELLISGLEPYIDVIQIGDTTSGKFQASITLYDSPDYSKSDINTAHTYALQPLVLKSANKLGFTDYVDGLTPDISLQEEVATYGILGDPEEPLLKAAINLITTGATPAAQKRGNPILDPIGDSRMLQPNYQRMYTSLPNHWIRDKQ